MKFAALSLNSISESTYSAMMPRWTPVNQAVYSLDDGFLLHKVPTEKHIQMKLAEFQACLISAQPFTIQSATPEKIPREFSLFSSSLSKLSKSTPPPAGAHFIERCLTIEVQDKVVAAIYFTLDLDYRKTYINILEVNIPYQKNQFGCFLLHCAMYVGLLYGCTCSCLFALQSAIPFYTKLGFMDYVYQMRCDLTVLESQTLFLESIKKYAPYFANEVKQSILRAVYPVEKFPS